VLFAVLVALRKASAHIKYAKAPETVEIAKRMFGMVEENKAWGLSAPQIDEPIQMFIMATPKVPGPRQLPTLGQRLILDDMALHYTAFLNPMITKVSDEVEADLEVCMSIPGMSALVPRHTWIEVQFRTLDNNLHVYKFEDHPARVFQHEFDHLEGIMMFDRILDTSDIYVSDEVTRQLEEKYGSLGENLEPLEGVEEEGVVDVESVDPVGDVETPVDEEGSLVFEEDGKDGNWISELYL